jgi:hypothetical protein
MEFSFLQIDVHYSLPRDDQKQGGDRDKNQVGSTITLISRMTTNF